MALPMVSPSSQLPFEYHGERLMALAGRAIYWPAREALLVADTHFGKDAAFRHAGIPVSSESLASDLRRLEELLELTRAARLIVLGDFLHAETGRTEAAMEALAAWRGRWRGLECLLVRGNHDLEAGDPPADWGFRCEDEPFALGPFALRHHPLGRDALDAGAPVLAGHLHPGVTLTGPGRDRLRAPCFWMMPRQLILPSFGSFTGCGPVEAREGDRVFVTCEGQIVEPAARIARLRRRLRESL